MIHMAHSHTNSRRNPAAQKKKPMGYLSPSQSTWGGRPQRTLSLAPWGSPSHRQAHPRQQTTRCHVLGCWEGRMPLVGFEWASGALGSAARPHTVVVVADNEHTNQQCVVVDFMPIDPTSPLTAAKLLTGGRAPGEVRSRVLPRFIKGPHLETRWVGPIATAQPRLEDLLKEIQKFNSSWDTELSLVNNNCQHHTKALIAHLTVGMAQQP